MGAGPYFDSGGFRRDQVNSVGVHLVDVNGNPYTAGGGAGASTVDSQMQFKEGAAFVYTPGTAARGLLVDPINGTTDGAVGLPGRIGIVGGYDGTNARALKTSAAGVVQVDVLSNPAGGATLAEQQTQTTRLTSIRDRLPAATRTSAASGTDEGMVVHVATQPAGGAAGTQYTEADVDATITGNALMWEDTSDTLRAVSVAKPLPVSQQGTVTITGALTDTQLRASAVPVSGPLTDTQLRASAVPVDSELTTGDLDTGAGTDTRAVIGLVRAESGGGLLVGSANPLPVTFTTLPAGTNNIGDVDVLTLPPLPAGTNNIGDVDVLTLPANASVNQTQIAGTAVDVNSGVKSAGTQRVVIATDQPALSTPMPVSGTVTANAGTGPFPVSDNAGSLTVDAPVGTPVFVRLSDGAANLIGQKTMANSLPVVFASDQSALTIAALPAGTNNIGDVDVLTLPGIAGTVAHDAADSGNPVKVGARAISADIAAVAANDRSDLLATLLGKLLILPYALPGATVSGSGNKTDTTDLSLMPAPGAGIRNYVTHITITNAHATVGTKVVLKDGSTIIWRGYADALGGGVSGPLPTPLRLTANTALNGACITTGADVDFSVVGFTAAE